MAPFPTDFRNAVHLASSGFQRQNGHGNDVALSNFDLALATASDPDVEECALVTAVTTVSASSSTEAAIPHTRILLQSNLLNCYDRTVTTVNANVGLATHGQSVGEVMGSGLAATPNRVFTLRQSPLTYIQSPTPTGRQSTLQVRANCSCLE